MSKTVWSQKMVPREEITLLLQVGICCILPYNQIIKRNNQIMKMNNQIFRITLHESNKCWHASAVIQEILI